jgi:SAM-dependent methyltransferase
MIDNAFTQWLDALEKRHLANLQFAEVTRALRALSSTYIERRGRLAERSAFDSAGKRAAYALYYSPLHFLTVRMISDALGPSQHALGVVLDLGCGAGAAGAAFASQRSGRPIVVGVDAHPWAVAEAAFTYRTFKLDGTVKRGDAARVTIPRKTEAIILGWVLNEVDTQTRDALRLKLLQAATSGAELLIIEPISRRISPWWNDWRRAFEPLGARADEWTFPAELPELLQGLARAAGLRHEHLKAKSLYVASIEMNRERGTRLRSRP